MTLLDILNDPEVTIAHVVRRSYARAHVMDLESSIHPWNAERMEGWSNCWRKTCVAMDRKLAFIIHLKTSAKRAISMDRKLG